MSKMEKDSVIVEETKYTTTKLDFDLTNSSIGHVNIVNGDRTTIQGNVINHLNNPRSDNPQTNNHCHQNNEGHRNADNHKSSKQPSQNNEVGALYQENENKMKDLVKKVARCFGEPEDFMYNMGSQGYVHIINNINFDCPKHTKREGSDRDVKMLKELFCDTIGWEKFKVEPDLTVDGMKSSLKNISDNDFSKYGAFFLIILSHGTKYGICGKDSNPNTPGNVLNVEHDVLPLFTNTECPTLREKPKVFIMQACRGDMDDNGYCVESDAIMTQPPDRYKRQIPDTSEYLLCYPCAPGYTSLRNTGIGSIFIQCLVQVLKERHDEEDISRMLVRLNYKVARQDNSLRIKQMPSHDNRLTRLTYFKSFFMKKKRILEEKGLL